jgi:hypothetical protein
MAVLPEQRLKALRSVCESIADWWKLSLSDLDQLSRALIGPRQGGWIRKGEERAIVALTKYGAVAKGLEKEMQHLSTDAARILAKNDSGRLISAVAFYHVRFENIHPLNDGNGRLGRTIMAGQLLKSAGVSPAMFERRLEGRFYDYKKAFRLSEDSLAAYLELSRLLGEITGLPIPAVSLGKELSFEPLNRPAGSAQNDPVVLRFKAKRH